MKSLRLLFLILISLISVKSYSQTSSLSGTLYTVEEKTIPYANLTLQELSIQTTSDANGKYSFVSVPFVIIILLSPGTVIQIKQLVFL